MESLTRFDKGGIELIINTATGEAYASQIGYARMSGVNYSTVKKRIERLKGGDINTFETAEIQTAGGLQVVTLLSADLVYDWMFDDNPPLAKAMGKAGATVFMHELAGFKVSSTATSITQELLQLPPADIRISNLISALDRIGFDMENPRFNQGIKDITGDILGIGRSALKPATSETWCGVAERAEQLGHPVGEVSRKRSQLGKWVARGGLLKKQEARLCNGTQRSINLYLVDDELDFRINSFFEKA